MEVFYDALSKMRVEVVALETMTFVTSMYTHKNGHIHKLLTAANSNLPAPLLIVKLAKTVIYVLARPLDRKLLLLISLLYRMYSARMYVCLWYEQCISGLDESTS